MPTTTRLCSPTPALLTSSPEGRTAYIHADLREPQSILANPSVSEILDFSQPIALMLVAILHFVPDEFKPDQVIATLVGALPSGSYRAGIRVAAEDHRTAPGAGRGQLVRRGQDHVTTRRFGACYRY
jgi:hypothetical protein